MKRFLKAAMIIMATALLVVGMISCASAPPPTDTAILGKWGQKPVVTGAPEIQMFEFRADGTLLKGSPLMGVMEKNTFEASNGKGAYWPPTNSQILRQTFTYTVVGDKLTMTTGSGMYLELIRLK